MGGKRKVPLTHCKKGHQYTSENTWLRVHKDGHSSRVCKMCRKESAHRFAEANPERRREYSRNWARNNPRKDTYDYATRRDRRLRCEYGITSDQYDQMLSDQEGRCAICNDYMSVPCVDHNHETKKVRGLLCRACNAGIGQLRDDPEIVACALRYLKG